MLRGNIEMLLNIEVLYMATLLQIIKVKLKLF